MNDQAASAGAPWRDEGWQFILQFYAQPGVSACCLRLQEQASVDVMVLLLACYQYAERGIALSDDDIAAADAAVRDWRTGMVHPIRALRRQAKAASTSSPATEGAAALAQALAAAELQAERMAWNRLASHGPVRNGQAAANAGGGSDLVLRVVRHFQGREAQVTDECRQAIAAIQSLMEQRRAG